MLRFGEHKKQNFTKEHLPPKHCQNNLWLLKPSDLNQGRGIIVTDNLAEITKHLSQRANHDAFVIQKYIEKPLLFNNRKFDIRMWALVSKDYEVYFHRQG